MSFCIYCGKEKSSNKFSNEHVIPKALGGNLEPDNPFLTDEVCNRCNNISGIFIDEPFIKSWFTQNNRAKNSIEYIDLDKDIIIPLTFMGEFEKLHYKDKICELWLGPTGDQIFHFHKPYPKSVDVPPIVGIPTHTKRKKIDYGFAFIFVRANNPRWHKTILYSFAKKFKKSKLYLGNGPRPRGDAFSKIPEELLGLQNELIKKACSSEDKKDKYKLNMVLSQNYGDRFLAKLALGLGSIFLKKTFKKSESADLLRNFMWTKSSEKRSKIPLPGKGFSSKIFSDGMRKIMKWSGGHILYILPQNDRLFLYTNFYDMQEGLVLISSEPEHWKNTIVDSYGGIIYVITPFLQNYVGPKEFAKYINHKNGNSDKDLLRLENDMRNNKDVPPYNI